MRAKRHPDERHEGRCACASIVVSFRGEVALARCHCSQCRKTAGAPFQCVFPVPSAALEIDDRGGTLREFRASADKVRAFCGSCGAPVYSRRDGSPSVRLRAGLFDELGPLAETGHIFWPARAVWDDTNDELPCFDTVEPARLTS